MMQIALYKPEGGMGRIIDLISRGPWCHASTILDDGSVIEAREFHGVRKLKDIREGNKTGRIIDIFDVNLTDKEEQIVSEFLHKQIGKGYDYWMVLGFVLYATREGRKAYSRWFCSELVFAAFEKADFLLLERVEPWKVNPYNISWSNRIIYNRTIIV